MDIREFLSGSYVMIFLPFFKKWKDKVFLLGKVRELSG